MGDSSTVMRKLADNRRILLASPAYLDRHGRPGSVADLQGHTLLGYGNANVPWTLTRVDETRGDGTSATATTNFRLTSDNGDVVRDWAVAGHGITMKSHIDVQADLASGALERVMPGWHGGDAAIVALYPSSRHMPLKTSILLDALSDALRSVETADA